MDAVKTMLMGCGALALLSVVGCVGISGASYYAIDQAIEEERARQAAAGSAWKSNRANRSSSSDPFSDYDSNTYDDSSDEGGWGDEAQ